MIGRTRARSREAAANPIPGHGRTERAPEGERHGRCGRFGFVTPGTPQSCASDPGAASRQALESVAVANSMDQADRRARPLARRFLSTARPARVLIRERNPCFFARRWVLGWNVRFTTSSSMTWRDAVPGRHDLFDARREHSQSRPDKATANDVPAATTPEILWPGRFGGSSDHARLLRPARSTGFPHLWTMVWTFDAGAIGGCRG